MQFGPGDRLMAMATEAQQVRDEGVVLVLLCGWR
ncbi:hypothetical protein CF161_12721 [Pseudomonas sp. CF161]|nr:hypothetical protein CF161_12721 [Pseudomonas sp. CF161]